MIEIFTKVTVTDISKDWLIYIFNFTVWFYMYIHYKKNMTSTVDDFCETSNSDVLKPMLILQNGHLSLSQDTVPTLDAIK